MEGNNVAILLATYNSSLYLKPQLDSLLKQSFSAWKLYIRDDGSRDGTLEIIDAYAKQDPRIILVKDTQSNRGAAGSFMYLLENTAADYFFFCDHDDVWLPEKVEKSMQVMRKLESEHPNKPVIVHSDLYVVDQGLNVIHHSFWKSSGIRPEILSNERIIQVFNCVTGCTMVFNKAAKQCSLPFAQNAPMHDWWVTIKTLQHKGKVFGISEPLIYYRQHLSNEVGARDVNLNYFMNKLRHLSSTFNGQLKQIRFLKSINGIGFLSYYYHKFLYTLIRKL